jgi:hypothetical protein
LKELLGIAPASNCPAASVTTAAAAAAAQLQHKRSSNMDQAANDTAVSRQRDQGNLSGSNAHDPTLQ